VEVETALEHLKEFNMRNDKQFAIVITHTGARKKLLDMDWLELDYRVDESDWIVLSEEEWRAVARGQAPIWEDLQRKLLIGLYLSQPELIAVIGHPLDEGLPAAGQDTQREDVGRIVRRVRSLLLPTTIIGFWADEDGWLIDVVEPSEKPAAGMFAANVLEEQGEPAA
jgi:hypothetical protein